MRCQAQSAFEKAQMIFENVRVFVDVDTLKCQLAQPLTSVRIGFAGASKATT
jgi:hypothetical protein